MLRISVFILSALILIITGLATADTEKQAQTSTPPAPVKIKESRGEMLYENHCPVCHDSKAHIRIGHKVRSVSDLNMWVSRWSTELKLQWKPDDIDAVVDYLNKRYYKFTAK